jgi:hypothetical protein
MAATGPACRWMSPATSRNSPILPENFPGSAGAGDPVRRRPPGILGAGGTVVFNFRPPAQPAVCAYLTELTGHNYSVTRVVHVPYAVEQDGDGVWCASAQLRPGVGAVGHEPTLEAAIADLRAAVEVLLAEVGPPDELRKLL